MTLHLAASKPPMDAELRAALDSVSFPLLSRVTPEVTKMMREATATPPSWLKAQEVRGISHREVRIPSKGASKYEIALSILNSSNTTEKLRPCIYWIHGGGFHWGDKLHTLEYAIDMILDCGALCISVEYRLAPESSYTTAVEDCYAGLEWASEHALEIGIDPERLIVGGCSAGGGLAASTVLLCHNRRGPAICAQLLICPALDNRLTSISSQQYTETSDFFPRTAFEDLLESLKNASQGAEAEDIVFPAMVKDLSGLPTTYLDVGSAEILRDETVAYASRLWASGVQAELHVWPGGFHGFDMFAPTAAVSRASREAKLRWAKRVFGV